MLSNIWVDNLIESRLMLVLGLINLISCLLRLSANVNRSLKTLFFVINLLEVLILPISYIWMPSSCVLQFIDDTLLN